MKRMFDRIVLWLTAAAALALAMFYLEYVRDGYSLFLIFALLLLLWQCYAYWKARAKNTQKRKEILATLLGGSVMFVFFLGAWILRPSLRSYAVFSGIGLGNLLIDRLWKLWGLEALEQEVTAVQRDETVWPPPPTLPPPAEL